MLTVKINTGILRLQEFLAKKPFYRHVIVLVTGTTLAQTVAVLASPILTRLYSPKEFGLLTVYVAILSIFALLGTLQYENAIPLPKEEDSAANLLVFSFVILLGICALSGISLWAGKTLILKMMHAQQLMGYLWLIPFSLLGVGIYNILYSWNMRRKTFDRIAKTKITQSFGMIGTQITAGLLTQGSLGLFLGDVIGRMGGSGRLTYLIIKEDWQVLRKVTGRGILREAVRYKRFPLISGGAALLRELSEQMPAFLFAVAYGPREVGWFLLAQRILEMPLSLIGYSVGNVYMAEALSLIQDKSGKKLFALYWQTLKHLFFLSLPFIVVLCLFAPGAVPFVFGLEWREAGIYLRILCPMYLLKFLSLPVSFTVYVLERQDLQLIREIIRFVLLLFFWVMVMASDLSPKAAMGLLAMSGSVAFVINGIMSWLAIKQNTNTKAEDIAG